MFTLLIRDNFLSCIAWIIVILVSLKESKCNIEGIEPGQCLSKFDYDYKVMQKLLHFEREIQDLKHRKACRDTEKVSFMAELSADFVDPTTDTTVVFDSVRTNVGDGYKPGPGIFIVPVNGTYSFSLVASSSRKAASANLHLYMMHSGLRVGYIFLDQNNDRWLQRSATIVLEAHAEDTIYVKIGRRIGKGTLDGCCLHTHFSGFLIN